MNRNRNFPKLAKFLVSSKNQPIITYYNFVIVSYDVLYFDISPEF